MIYPATFSDNPEEPFSHNSSPLPKQAIFLSFADGTAGERAPTQWSGLGTGDRSVAWSILVPIELAYWKNGRSPGSKLWRYVHIPCLAIFSGDIPWNLALKNRPNMYGIGTSVLNRFLIWPVKVGPCVIREMQVQHGPTIKHGSNCEFLGNPHV